MRRWKYLAGVMGTVCALTVGLAGSADAAAWTWQSYTKDSTWHCGSTEDLNGLYLQPCVKITGPAWQPVMIATATSQARYISSSQEGDLWANGAPYPQVISFGDCVGPYGGNLIYLVPAWTSLACFSQDASNRDSLVEGSFDEGVWTSISGTEVTDNLSSPGIVTGL